MLAVSHLALRLNFLRRFKMSGWEPTGVSRCRCLPAPLHTQGCRPGLPRASGQRTLAGSLARLLDGLEVAMAWVRRRFGLGADLVHRPFVLLAKELEGELPRRKVLPRDDHVGPGMLPARARPDLYGGRFARRCIPDLAVQVLLELVGQGLEPLRRTSAIAQLWSHVDHVRRVIFGLVDALGRGHLAPAPVLLVRGLLRVLLLPALPQAVLHRHQQVRLVGPAHLVVDRVRLVGKVLLHQPGRQVLAGLRGRALALAVPALEKRALWRHREGHFLLRKA
mmetsp:Transcript_39884/g.120443  ORF Transcript_39884/g.120443 Transcript_39884/m.120443 type:complete len:279 (-) Transcript_39884:323-1159(-)